MLLSLNLYLFYLAMLRRVGYFENMKLLITNWVWALHGFYDWKSTIQNVKTGETVLEGINLKVVD